MKHLRYTIFSPIIRFICLLFLSVVALSSCGSDDPVVNDKPEQPAPDKPTEPTKNHYLKLSIADSTIMYSHKEDTKLIWVTCDTSFTAEVNQDWLTAEASNSSKSLQLNISQNDTDAERSATLTVKSDAGLKHTLQIKQDYPTKIVSASYKIGNSLLDEPNIATLTFNRELKNITANMISFWPMYDKPKSTLLDDKKTLEISGLQGFGSNYTYNISAKNDNNFTFNENIEVWLCDDHWSIEGRLVGHTIRATKPNHSYAVTKFPDRLYDFNPKTGEQHFCINLGFTPTGLSYCTLNDEVYVLGEDNMVHIYGANDGAHRRDVKLLAPDSYGKYNKIVLTDEGWGLVVSDNEDRCMIDASRNDKVYQLPEFVDWSAYRFMEPSLGSDGKVWFSTLMRQLYRIESAEGPVTQPAVIDGYFNHPEVHYMGGVWSTYVWKPGQNKVFISANPTSQTIFNFDTQQYDFYTLIETRMEGNPAFDMTQPSEVDRLWWVRKTGYDFLIVEDRKIIFWSKNTRNANFRLANLPDGKTMITAFETSDNSVIKTNFEVFDVEKFNATANFAESYAGW